MGKRVAIVLLVVAALVAVGFLAQRILFSPANPTALSSPSAAPSASANGPFLAKVVRSEGTVERRSSTGDWIPVLQGDVVNLSDVIRTGPDGSADIALSDDVTVTASESTSFTVAEVSRTISKVQLEDGRISGNVRGSEGMRFRVQVRGTDAVAETDSGEFAVLRRGDGPVAVAATRGRVRLSARDKAVEVAAGEQSVVEPGSAPSEPVEIPASLFLKLGKPPTVEAEATDTNVGGRTAPGAVVSMGGVRVPIGSDGSFEGRVPVPEGANEIVVVVEDALGRRVERAVTLARAPTKVPKVSGSVQW